MSIFFPRLRPIERSVRGCDIQNNHKQQNCTSPQGLVVKARYPDFIQGFDHVVNCGGCNYFYIACVGYFIFVVYLLIWAATFAPSTMQVVVPNQPLVANPATIFAATTTPVIATPPMLPVVPAEAMDTVVAPAIVDTPVIATAPTVTRQRVIRTDTIPNNNNPGLQLPIHRQLDDEATWCTLGQQDNPCVARGAYAIAGDIALPAGIPSSDKILGRACRARCVDTLAFRAWVPAGHGVCVCSQSFTLA